ncbi:MAG: TVP38/TMEM64 family protein [Gemmataceae bacterium]|nr:TVP38/TMEM64 family protein [Gemmataceae bacterium]MDW8265417.1 TVP38/TMEM64 family protein [Gemmataceae bacterium]
MTRTATWRLVLGLLVVGLLAGALLYREEVAEHFADLLTTVQTIGPWGPWALAAAYVAAAVLCFPGSLLTLGAGFAFGFGQALAAVSVGSVAGATAAFCLGRTIARPWVEHLLAGRRRFHALDRAVAERGFHIVLLSRLSPLLPYTLLNYAFGLTSVRLRDYVLASWLGMLPGTVMYVYLGTLGRDLAELATGRRERSPGELGLWLLGLAATVVVSWLLTRLARQALADSLREALPEDTDERPASA